MPNQDRVYRTDITPGELGAARPKIDRATCSSCGAEIDDSGACSRRCSTRRTPHFDGAPTGAE